MAEPEPRAQEFQEEWLNSTKQLQALILDLPQAVGNAVGEKIGNLLSTKGNLSASEPLYPLRG